MIILKFKDKKNELDFLTHIGFISDNYGFGVCLAVKVSDKDIDEFEEEYEDD